MRAGAFADLRVIRLINRRFVPFFFNSGGPGLGHDENANDFIQELAVDFEKVPDLKILVDPDERKSNTIAYFAAFSAADEAKVLGIADGWKNEKEAYDLERLYPSKDVVFQFLMDLLENNPEFNQLTDEEKQIFANADSNPGNQDALLAAANVWEELGQYEKAKPFYRKALEISYSKPDSTAHSLTAFRGLLRIARYQKAWDAQDDLILQISETKNQNDVEFAADVAMEQAYQMLDKENYEELKQHLEQSIEKFPKSSRMGELRYYAGVASFFLDDKPNAYFHWCWIVENIPDDHLSRRAYVSAAHKNFPYPNSELGGIRSSNSVNNEMIQAAYDEAKKHYDERMESTNPSETP